MSLGMERIEMKQSQPLRLLPFARNDCKYFCPITYLKTVHSLTKYETPLQTSPRNGERL